MPTEEQVPKEKDKIAGTESKEEGMSNGFEIEGKNEQEKREVSEQKRREEDGDRDIIMIRGREADSEEESKEEGKRDGSVTVKVPLEGGKIEKMSFGTSEEAGHGWGISQPNSGGSRNRKNSKKNSYKPQKWEI